MSSSSEAVVDVLLLLLCEKPNFLGMEYGTWTGFPGKVSRADRWPLESVSRLAGVRHREVIT